MVTIILRSIYKQTDRYACFKIIKSTMKQIVEFHQTFTFSITCLFRFRKSTTFRVNNVVFSTHTSLIVVMIMVIPTVLTFVTLFDITILLLFCRPSTSLWPSSSDLHPLSYLASHHVQANPASWRYGQTIDVFFDVQLPEAAHILQLSNYLLQHTGIIFIFSSQSTCAKLFLISI